MITEYILNLYTFESQLVYFIPKQQRSFGIIHAIIPIDNQQFLLHAVVM